MFPFIAGIPTNLILAMIAAIASIALLSPGLTGRGRYAKASALVLGSGALGLIGARLLHVVWERPELLRTPRVIFSRWDGLVFYGGLFLGTLGFILLSRVLVAQRERSSLGDRASIATALSYGILRIGCFAEGCCWGSVSSASWAVRYPFDSHSVMPAPGIPVHPVQLYDSALGFFTAMLLYAAWRRKVWEGALFPVFCALYAAGRMITESFRGDDLRGVRVLGMLSTSQVISVGVIAMVTLWIFRRQLDRKPRWTSVKFAMVVLMAAGLSGCILPEPPSPESYSKTVIRPGYEIYRMTPYAGSIQRKNALFLTADEYLYRELLPKLRDSVDEAQSDMPSLDNLVWWKYFPSMRGLYSEVMRITLDEAKHETVEDALRALESRGQPYDVYFLSHGMPNYLSSGDGYFFSFKDIDELKGKLTHLNLVFMQSCFGSTLVEDWKQAGAQAVVSFPGFNRNFFWIDFFLRNYRREDLAQAYADTNEGFDSDFENDPLYQRLVQATGTRIQDYLKEASNPEISVVTGTHRSPASGEDRFRRAMIFPGGAFNSAMYLGMLAAYEKRGLSPDLIIGTCGGSIAAAIAGSFDSPEQQKQFMESREFYRFLQKLALRQDMARLDQTLEVVLGSIMREEFELSAIPNLFGRYLIDFPNRGMPVGIQEFPRTGRRILITGTRLNYGPADVGKTLSGPLYQEVYFTDPETAEKIKRLHLESAAAFAGITDSFMDRNVTVDSSVQIDDAVRASIADPFLIAPKEIHGRYYMTGASNMYPVELARGLADEVFLPYSRSLSFLLNAVYQGTLGVSDAIRDRHVISERVDRWIDISDTSAIYDQAGMNPYLDWQRFYVLSGLPDRYDDYVRRTDELWNYGFARGEESLRFSRGSTAFIRDKMN